MYFLGLPTRSAFSSGLKGQHGPMVAICLGRSYCSMSAPG